jgi:hypothetical protein
VLRDGEVRRKLDSGLTNAFLISADGVSPSGKRVDGSARIEVRYELWDEHYLITTTDAGGRMEHRTIDTFAHLEQWWSHQPFQITGALLPEGVPAHLRVRLKVLPYSPRELDDAQRWLANQAGERPSEPGATEQRGSSQSNLLSVIVGTSMERRPILDYRWNVPVEGAR